MIQLSWEKASLCIKKRHTCNFLVARGVNYRPNLTFVQYFSIFYGTVLKRKRGNQLISWKVARLIKYWTYAKNFTYISSILKSIRTKDFSLALSSRTKNTNYADNISQLFLSHSLSLFHFQKEYSATLNKILEI